MKSTRESLQYLDFWKKAEIGIPHFEFSELLNKTSCKKNSSTKVLSRLKFSILSSLTDAKER